MDKPESSFTLELRLLGPIELRGADGRSIDAVVAQSKRFALLAYLAVLQRPARRDSLLGLFWPESDQGRARHALNQTVHFLRNRLGSEVIETRGAEDLVLGPHVWCDVQAFERAVEEGHVEDAAEIYRGPLLEGVHVDGSPELDTWLSAQRARLERLHGEALESLADEAEDAGRYEDAVRWWEKRAVIDPYDGRIAVRHMRALEGVGRRTAAIEEARLHAQRMREEFDAEPDPDVAALERKLREAPEKGAVLPALLRRIRSDAPGPRRSWRLRPRHLAGAVILVLLVYAAVATMPETGAQGEFFGRRVVAAPFENRSGDPALDPLGRFAADWITQGLVRTGVVDVVPSVLTSRAARALAADTSNMDFAAALAEETQAGILVAGSFIRERDSLLFQAQIIDAETGRLLRAIDGVKTPLDLPLQGIEEMRGRVAGALSTFLDGRLQRWAQNATQPPSYEAYLKYVEGLDHFFSRRYADAGDALVEAAELDSTFAAPLVWALFAYGNANDYAATDSVFARLHERRDLLSPWERALYEMSVAGEAKDRQGILRAARKVASLAPGTEWNYVYAYQSYKANRPAEAVAALEAIDPEGGWTAEWPSYWGVLTDARHALGQFEQELDDARRSQRQHGERGDVKGELRALAALGRVREAVTRAGELSTSDFERLSRLMLVAEELLAHGHPAAGLDVARQALALAPEPEDVDDPRYRESLLWRRASLHEMLGDRVAARAAYERLQREFPDDPWVRIGHRASLGHLAAATGDTTAARETIRWLVEQDPEIYREGVDAATHIWMAAEIAGQLGDCDMATRLTKAAYDAGYLWLAGKLTHSGGLEPVRECAPLSEFLRPQG